MDDTILNSIRNAGNDDEALYHNKESIISESHITMESDASVLKHFGISEFSSDLTLQHLYNNWCKELENWNKEQRTKYHKLDWMSDLVKEMVRIIRNRPAPEILVPLKSVNPGDFSWYSSYQSRSSFVSRC